MTTKLVPPAPRCCQTKTEPADEIPGPDPSGACPAAAVAAAYHGVCAAMPLDLLPSGRNPIIFGTAVGNPRLPHARFLPPLIMLRDLALPSKPNEGAYGWRPRGLSWNLQTCFPSFPIAPISAVSTTYLLKWSAYVKQKRKQMPSDLETPIRYAWREYPRLHSHRRALPAVPLK